jgi:FkbH-like protein
MERIALLSNINLDSLKFKLRKEYDLFIPDGYNTWRQELLNDASGFYLFQPQFCFIIIDGWDIFSSLSSSIIDETFSCIEYVLNALPHCRFFISDMDIYDPRICDSRAINADYRNEAAWLDGLRFYLEKFDNVYHFPLKDLITNNGRDVVYSPKMWYLSSNRFSILGERLLVEKIRKLMRPAHIPSKKCLVLDLDNTLWGGIIGEDGIEGIQLDDHGEGARFYEFQKILKEIRSKGILLAVISKNNMEDVENVFSNPHMVLQKEDFIAMAINWNTKSVNIVQIADDLNIGLDTFVFIDDNPVEREEMRQLQSDVVVANFPEDTTQLPHFAIEIYDQYFYSWDFSQEDIKKSQMYRENAQRHKAATTFTSLEDFLKDMNIRLTIKQVDSEYVIRAFQMLQKTNQFNLTTIRYSKEDVSRMLSDNNTLVLMGHVQDKYGDNGNSILLIARMISAHEAEIDSFLMSCRIMNRSIEFGFLYEAEKMLKAMGADIIHARYIRTAKNSPAGMFFDEAGYKIISDNEKGKRYALYIKDNNTRIAKKSYITIESL